MAESCGSISCRLAEAYTCHLFKIMWEEDVNYLPENKQLKKDFFNLKKLIRDDMLNEIEKKRNAFILLNTTSMFQISKEIAEKYANENITAKYVISTMHYKKATKIAKLINKILYTWRALN
jgi:hypothetical protein